MSYSYDIFSTDGKKLKSHTLNAELFNDESINETVIHQYVVLQEANARIAIASTKTRAEVRGSGRKLHKQKGSGAARVGDNQSPIRKGGGVAWGPTGNENFSKSLNKKAKRLALRGILTAKAKEGMVSGLDSFEFKEIKTKNAFETLKNLKLQDTKTLVVIPQKDEGVTRSFANLAGAKYILAAYLNPFDLLSHKHVILLGDSIKIIEENLSK